MFNLQLLNPSIKLLLEHIITYLTENGFENMDNPEEYLADTAIPSGIDADENHWAEDETFWTVYDHPNGVAVLVGIDPHDEEFNENQTSGEINAHITMQVGEYHYLVDQYGWDAVVEPLIRTLLASGADAMRHWHAE